MTTELVHLRKWLVAFCTALRFLTILPVRYRMAEDEVYFRDAVVCFPFVGIVIGCMAAGLTLFLQLFLPQMVTVSLGILFLAAISNFLHLDGVADSADGLLSSRNREKSLAIMKDSRVGAMGVVALIFLLLIKFAALSAVSSEQLSLALFWMPVAGRIALVATMGSVAYARDEGGLGLLFYSSSSKKYALGWGMIFAVFLALCLRGFGLILFGALFVVLYLFNRKCEKHLGGATGDTIGAQCELAEMVVAVCFATL